MLMQHISKQNSANGPGFSVGRNLSTFLLIASFP